MPNASASSKIPSGYRRLPGSDRSAAPDAELIWPGASLESVRVTAVRRRLADGPAVRNPAELPEHPAVAAPPPVRRGVRGTLRSR